MPGLTLGLGRRGRAVELNTGYFLDGVKYLEAKEREVGMPSLFDFTGDRAPAANDDRDQAGAA